MDLSSIKIDLAKEKNGVWEDLDGETSVLVARMNNPNFNKRFQELTELYRSAARKGMLTDERAEDILVTCLAETILLDWKGLKEAGVEVPYSVEKAKEILSNAALSTFRRVVVEISDNQAKYRDTEITESAGKSVSSSSGI